MEAGETGLDAGEPIKKEGPPAAERGGFIGDTIGLKLSTPIIGLLLVLLLLIPEVLLLLILMAGLLEGMGDSLSIVDTFRVLLILLLLLLKLLLKLLRADPVEEERELVKLVLGEEE